MREEGKRNCQDPTYTFLSSIVGWEMVQDNFYGLLFDGKLYWITNKSEFTCTTHEN